MGRVTDGKGPRGGNRYRFSPTPAGRSLVLLSLGQGFYRISGLLLVSMYASQLGPAEYGRLEQLLALSLLVTPLVSLQVYESFLSVFQHDNRSGASAAATILACMTVVCIAGAWAFATLWPAYAGVAAAFAAHVVTTTAWQIMRNMLRAMRRLEIAAQGEALQSVLSLGLGALLLFGRDWGVIGVLVAVAVANAGASAYAGLRCLDRGLVSPAAVSRHTLVSILSVSMRLVPNVALWWGIELLDRMFLAWFLGDHAVGIYSGGARIAGILMSAVLLLYQFWQIPAIDALQRKDRNFFGSTLGPFTVTTVMGASALLAVAQPLSAVLLGDEFVDSRRFVAVLVPASCLAALCYFFGIIYYSAQDRFSAIQASASGLLVSIATNLLFIPLIGSIAAAWAALLAYFVILAMRYREARECLGVRLHWRTAALPIAIACAQALGLYHAVPWPVLTIGTLALAVVLRNELKHLLTRVRAPND